MKKILFVALAVLLTAPAFSQTAAEKGHVMLSLGSIRAPYLIFVSESEIASPLVEMGIPIGFSARFRAWSVPYFFNYRSMDIQAIARAPITLSPNFSLSPLIGYEIGLRNSADVRSAPNLKSWYVPTLGVMLTGRLDWFENRVQVEALPYGTGINLRAIPELGVKLGDVSILARAEFTYLLSYTTSDREFHWETFLSARLEF